MRETWLYDVLNSGKTINGNTMKGKTTNNITYELEVDHDFDEMLISWNGVLERSEDIEIHFEVFSKGRWSQTYKLMRWSRGENRGSFGVQADAFGSLNIDVFKVNKGIKIGKIRVHVISSGGMKPPKHIATKGLYISLLNEITDKVDNTEIDEENEGDLTCFMPAPALVQYPVEAIGNRICSPTSCAMAMNAFGKIVSPEDFAAQAYDRNGDIYGNWIINMAAVSQYGLRAVARHFSGLEDLALSLKKGWSVAVSVKTDKESGFKGALQTYPSGHLMLVTGFRKINETWYVMVNDPADFDPRNSKRLYSAKRLKKYWSGIGYEIGKLNPKRHFQKKCDGDQVFDHIKKWIPGISLDLRYSTDNNIFGHSVYPQTMDKFQMLRIGTLKKLTYAHDILAWEGYGLKIWDAYRPLAIQQKLWQVHPDEKYVAHPQKGSKHNRGCAVDCTLIDKTGRPMAMPSDFDDFSQRGRADRNDLDPDVKKRIDALQKAFIQAGFETIEDEWWHFHDSEWQSYDIV